MIDFTTLGSRTQAISSTSTAVNLSGIQSGLYLVLVFIRTGIQANKDGFARISLGGSAITTAYMNYNTVGNQVSLYPYATVNLTSASNLVISTGDTSGAIAADSKVTIIRIG